MAKKNYNLIIGISALVVIVLLIAFVGYLAGIISYWLIDSFILK